jgi:sugar phosphate isomerase/epimerase
MLSELGYAGTHLTVWSERATEDIDRLARVTHHYKLAVYGVYFMLNIHDPHQIQHTMALIQRIPVSTTIELAIYAGAPGQHQSATHFDDDAVVIVHRICDLAQAHGHTVVLYPHVDFWLESHLDAIRICQQCAHPALGISFNAYHWYALGNRDIMDTLTTMHPYLRAANICGSRRLPPGQGRPATIELIDEGDLDIFVLLCTLKQVGYNGPIGLQGYGIGGDVYTKLRRSRAAFDDLQHRIALRSHWARMHPPEHSS